jgi:hypothetical protein
MAIKRKSSSKKIYLAIILLVVLIVASAAAIIASQPKVAGVTVGVHVGDTFTYELKGFSNLTSIDAVDTPGFSQLNNTDYYKVTITAVNGTLVSLDTSWRLNDGTQTTAQQTIDVSNGNKTDANGFWPIYASNLNVGDKLRPTSADDVVVNASDTMDYANSSRTRNYMSTGGESTLETDPTGSTLRYDSIIVYFDKQTGMLESMVWITDYNNPVMREVTTWTLVDTSVWAVQ